mgnify:CR=1 FL=1
MSIDYFVSRAWRIVSMVAFGITLLFVYRGLPDPAAVHFGETGRGDGFLPKEEIFYLSAGIVTILNVLALLLIKSVANVAEHKRHVPPSPSRIYSPLVGFKVLSR